MALPGIKIKFEVDPTAAKKGLAEITKSLGATDAATDKYQKGLTALKRAQDSGLLTVKKYDKGLELLNVEYLRSAKSAAVLGGATVRLGVRQNQAANALDRHSKASRRSGAALQNVGFQLQDIVVQIQGGQGAVRALSQQLPQLLGGFGAKLTLIGVAVGIAIPLFAALGKAIGIFGDEAFDAGEDMKSLLDQIDQARFGVETDQEVKALKAVAEANEKLIFLQDRRVALVKAGVLENRALISLADEHIRQQMELVKEADAVVQSFNKRRIELGILTRLHEGIIGSVKAQLQEHAAVNAMQSATTRETVNSDEKARKFLETLQLLADKAREIPKAFKDTESALSQLDIFAAKLAGGDDDGAGGGGGGISESERAEEQRAAELEALIAGLQTDEEVINEFRERGLATLMAASEAELERLGGFNEAKLRLERVFQAKKAAIEAMGHRTDFQLLLGAGTNLLGAMGAFNAKSLKLAKVSGAAEALISTLRGASKALEKGFPQNLIFAATVMAQGLGLVSAIKGVSSGGGGGASISTAVPSVPSEPTPAAAAPAAAAQAPLNVRLSGLGPADMITGAQLSKLFDMLQDEGGDRGLIVSFAT